MNLSGKKVKAMVIQSTFTWFSQEPTNRIAGLSVRVQVDLLREHLLHNGGHIRQQNKGSILQEAHRVKLTDNRMVDHHLLDMVNIRMHMEVRLRNMEGNGVMVLLVLDHHHTRLQIVDNGKDHLVLQARHTHQCRIAIQLGGHHLTNKVIHNRLLGTILQQLDSRHLGHNILPNRESKEVTVPSQIKQPLIGLEQIAWQGNFIPRMMVTSQARTLRILHHFALASITFNTKLEERHRREESIQGMLRSGHLHQVESKPC
jgi:hypothetical protein